MKYKKKNKGKFKLTITITPCYNSEQVDWFKQNNLLSPIDESTSIVDRSNWKHLSYWEFLCHLFNTPQSNIRRQIPDVIFDHDLSSYSDRGALKIYLNQELLPPTRYTQKPDAPFVIFTVKWQKILPQSKLYKKYDAIIKSGRFAESEVKSLKKLLNNWQRSSLSEAERKDLRRRMRYPTQRTFELTTEQIQKGYDCLFKLAYTPTGRVRKTHPFKEEHLDMLHPLNFNKFYFLGYEITGNNRPEYYPVYQYNDRDGRFFDYIYFHWSSNPDRKMKFFEENLTKYTF